MDYGIEKCQQPQTGQLGGTYIKPTLRQQLEQKQHFLQLALNKVNAAIAALDANPQLEDFQNTLQAAQDSY